MAELILRRFRPEPGLVLRRFGPDPALLAQAEAVPPRPLSILVGPPGPPGGSGSVTRFNVASAATWIVPHLLGREPIAQVFLASGEQIFPDVTVDPVHITVTFASPQAGFVLAS